MKSIRSRGFTLIELLVVIAIIGLLASIILASLNTARLKGADATAQGDFDNIRTQSAIYYSNQSPNGYTLNGASVGAQTLSAAACGATDAANSLFVDPNIVQQIASANNAEGSNNPVKCAYAANLATWVVYEALNSPASDETGWCVDSTGVEKADNAPAGTSC